MRDAYDKAHLTKDVMPREFTPTPAVRAPEFPDKLDWIHTGGRKLTLAELRGKVVFLDFWTYG